MWTLGRVLRISVLLANLPSPGAGAVTCHLRKGREGVGGGRVAALQRGGSQVCRAVADWPGVVVEHLFVPHNYHKFSCSSSLSPAAELRSATQQLQ